jgi:CheY-like chemotaxis protein
METKTVLVIEDNALNMKLAKSLLQIGKYGVLEARDAETGIHLARNNHPDLILMDIQLPGMDGLNAARLIKKDNTLKHIPVVALTSYAMQGDEEKARDAGCVGYITKPIETKTFLDTVASFLKYDGAS